MRACAANILIKNGESGGARTRDHRIKSAFTVYSGTSSWPFSSNSRLVRSMPCGAVLRFRGKTRGKAGRAPLGRF